MLQALDLKDPYNVVYTVTGTSAIGTEQLSAIAAKLDLVMENLHTQEPLVDDDENQVTANPIHFTVATATTMTTEEISAKIGR